jgi:hypothetical protein
MDFFAVSMQLRYPRIFLLPDWLTRINSNSEFGMEFELANHDSDWTKVYKSAHFDFTQHLSLLLSLCGSLIQWN